VIDGETIRVTGNPKAQIKVYKEYTDAGYVLDLTKKSELKDGGIVEQPNYRLQKSIECNHKPTMKGSKCTRRTLDSIGKCWQHVPK
jgi:hypothetical protein